MDILQNETKKKIAYIFGRFVKIAIRNIENFKIYGNLKIGPWNWKKFSMPDHSKLYQNMAIEYENGSFGPFLFLLL